MKTIPLTQGKVALVDDEDHLALSRFKWNAIEHGQIRKIWYAQRTIHLSWPSLSRRKAVYCYTIKMHTEILGCMEGMVIDHINGDGLDNRRKNLRFATPRQNCLNSRRASWQSKSGIRNVEPLPNGKFRVRICIDGKRKSLGLFDTLKEASEAYNEAARKFYGAFAVLNVPLASVSRGGQPSAGTRPKL